MKTTKKKRRICNFATSPFFFSTKHVVLLSVMSLLVKTLKKKTRNATNNLYFANINTFSTHLMTIN